MKLSVRGMVLAAGILWGGCILFLGFLHLAFPPYATDFFRGLSSVYPWLHGPRSLAGVLIGTMDAFVDGAVAGLLFAWLYNACAGRRAEA